MKYQFMKNKKTFTSNKAIIFARVSSEAQRDNNSLDVKNFKMKEYCVRKGFEIIKEIMLVESSTKGDRLQFHEMIKFVRSHKEHVHVIVDAVDRLQIIFSEVRIIEELRTSGKLSLHFLRENQILDRKANSIQLMAYHLCVVMASNFANTISDNMNEKRRSSGAYPYRIFE
jgi:DNA invertase Pin-like site-specific DNA recombinase